MRNNNFFSSDIETFVDPHGRHTPYAIGIHSFNYTQIYYRSASHTLEDVSRELMVLIYDAMQHNKEKSLNIIFHNLSAFDGVFILSCFFDYDGISKLENLLNNDRSKRLKKIQVDPYIRDGKIFFIKVYKVYLSFTSKGPVERKELIIYIKDSLLILPLSLDKLANVYLNEKKIDFDVTKVNQTNFHSNSIRSEVIPYLKRDLILTYKVYKKAQESYLNLFGLDIKRKNTIAGIAFALFNTNYKKKSVVIKPPLSENHETFIRNAYKGGRVEVIKPFFDYRMHGVEMNSYDVNSLYPCVMQYMYPHGQSQMYNFRSSGFDLMSCDKLGFIHARVETTDAYIPVLPISIDGKLIFPNGTFVGTWYIKELQEAEKFGYIVHPLSGILYEEKSFMFKEYVNELYELRLEAKNTSNYANDLIFKLLLNALYGRFGLKNPSNYPVLIPNDAVDDVLAFFQFKNFHEFGKFTYVEITSSTLQTLNLAKASHSSITIIDSILKKLSSKNFIPRSSAVQLSAAITSNARIKMFHMLNKYSDVLHYTDTDSIYVKGTLDSELICSTKLGFMKHEKTITKAIFMNPKTYLIVDNNNQKTIKAKGAIKPFLSEEIFEEEYAKSFAESMETGSAPIQQVKFPIVRNIKKLSVSSTTKNFRLAISRSNKRVNIYDSEGYWVDTEPHLVDFNGSDNIIINK